MCDGVVMQVQRLIWAFLGSLLVSAGAFADSQVRDVRFGIEDDRTRIVIETSDPADFRAFTLDGPTDRLVVDMPASSWAVRGLDAGEGLGAGLVGNFRFFNNSATTSRVVFELDDPAVIASQFVLEPPNAGGNYRLVIDLAPANPGNFAATSGFIRTGGIESLIAERVEAVYTPPPSRARRVLVIDAGHGGRDPGSMSPGGTRESEVALEAARELRRQLEATGRYEVFMTRDRDVYPSWEDRVGVMVEQRADLFLSIHADSSADSSVHGTAVYTLNDRAENRARQRANQGPGPTDQADVNNILVELELREKRNQSTAFAEVLLEHLATAGPLLQNPHRQANLFVLLDSRVPAVLLEMGFVTNRNDEANLTSAAARRRQMGAVVNGIDAYFARRGDIGSPQENPSRELPVR
tara:strand:+ start:15955 stop:17184 length:1230 start_codon:yes stop_codon:yes gene_type:complete